MIAHIERKWGDSMNLINELDVYCFYNTKDQPLVSELHQSPLFMIESHLFVNYKAVQFHRLKTIRYITSTPVTV